MTKKMKSLKDQLDTINNKTFEEIDQIKNVISELKENNLDELNRRIKNTPHVKVVSEIDQEIEKRISNLEDEIHQNSWKLSKKNRKNDKKETLNKPVDKIDINEEYLILGDSNTKHLDIKRLNKFGLTKKIFCPHFESIIELCGKLKVITEPNKILLHCGTNDLDKYDNDPLKIVNKIEDTIKVIRQKFPSSTIVLSTLIPRKDEKFDDSIENINGYIKSLLTKFINIQIMNNNKIYKQQLSDNKHLNKRGFLIFLSNLKFVLYGEMPHVFQSRRNDKNQQRYHRNNRLNAHSSSKIGSHR